LHVASAQPAADKGWWRLPTLSQEHAAPHGALHLGAINIVLEAAAVDAVSTLVGHDASRSKAGS